MQLFVFQHGSEVKPGCCGWRTTTTYWMAESRDAAEQEITEETPNDEEPCGLCARCMVDLLSVEAGSGYEIVRTEVAR